MRGASASALSSQSKKREPGPRVKAECGQEFVMTGAGSTEDEGCKDLVLRQEMYNKQVENGTFKVGPKAKYEAARMTEQAKCKHPFEGLRWGANSTSMYASCGKCGLKSVVLFHRAKGEEISSSTPDIPAEVTSEVLMVNDAHVVTMKAGMVMADTGCRKAVGGSLWHHDLQKEMDKLNKPYTAVEMHELFQFGPGQPMRSLGGWRYNVGINGRDEIFTIAEADASLTGLCGPDDMARWGMKLDFAVGTMETHGCKRTLQASDTSHPCTSLLEYPENRAQWFTTTADEVDNLAEDQPSDTFGPADHLR